MELFPFQIAASTQIADRYAIYAKEPLLITRHRNVPFYQNLNAITGSGKTLILADAVAQIRSALSIEPIVLWLSKGKVVVWQTYSNLSSGKYSELIDGFTVKPLTECKLSDIELASGGLILVATTAKFNQQDKAEGDRKIYQVALDMADNSLWEMLKKRLDTTGRRRPFIIVYDEGHNLSSQQTTLLLELEPDALIAASATMKIPEALSGTISRLRQEKKWSDQDFIAAVKSSDVVQSGLVKQQILLGGYVTPMEIAIDDMLESMHRTENAAEYLGLPFKPKAIYVSNTNLVSGHVDNIQAPFEQRQARPILIWRHLVNSGIDPSKIAVYCNLEFHPKFPPPADFNLFSAGDGDYYNFTRGEYQHIIFNLTLQEGWDDPACYFAYIDKEMGSKSQITQIVGRVLRQPQAQHYGDPSLNTAHFYIRTDEKSVFEEVLQEIQEKISAETPEINLRVFAGSKGSAGKLTIQPKKLLELPEVVPDFSRAKPHIKKIISSMQDYKADQINTIGVGGRIQVLQAVGVKGQEHQEWVEVTHSNRVTARWVFTREIQKTYPRALNLCDIEDTKFDALVEYSSPAAKHVRDIANDVIKAYLEHSMITHNSAAPIEVPPVGIDPNNLTKFTNAIHEGYSDLNGFEKEFAVALDKIKRIWLRNLSRGLFEIPLLSSTGTRNFNPDFIVWVDRQIFAIDTKGGHLIKDAAERNLFSIKKVGNGPDLYIRLVSRGTWKETPIEQENGEGYTVWTLRNGRPHATHAASINEAVQLCLIEDS